MLVHFNLAVTATTVAFFLGACSAPLEPEAETGISMDPADRRVNRVIAICSTGLTQRSSQMLETVFDRGDVRLTTAVQREVEGIIFSDETIDSQDKLKFYQEYLMCIETNLDAVTSTPSFANGVVKIVASNTNIYQAPRGSGFYDIAEFQRVFRNSADVSVSCVFSISGAIRSRGSDRLVERDQEKTFELSLNPGQTVKVADAVGIEFFDNPNMYSSTAQKLECWFN